VLLLRDYNTRVVVAGATLLGLAAGVVGTFLLLRKRSLLGDALSHATLPGIALAFVVFTALNQSGKHLGILLAGATLSGVLGMLAVLWIRAQTRLKEDAAMGIVLGVFFGLGTVLVRMAQDLPGASAAGLESFIYGKTASMLASDAQLIASAALGVVILSLLFYKELKLLCFDAGYARAQGWPVTLLDLSMMAMVVAVTVVGLQAVGLILILAMLIIPPAAARFWTDRLSRVLLLSGGFGAAAGWMGASISAVTPNLPAGAIIVLVSSVLFVVSLLAGSSRGLVIRWLQHAALSRRIGRQNLLRAIYELTEQTKVDQPVALTELLPMRAWTRRTLARLAGQARGEGFVVELPQDRVRLTESGLAEARRLVRDHRLWELYLITHADLAPSHVDRSADAIEHVLGERLVGELSRLLDAQEAAQPVPVSPHQIAVGRSAAGTAGGSA
jgi:manganese/zinc/iron transport system permease protein